MAENIKPKMKWQMKAALAALVVIAAAGLFFLLLNTRLFTGQKIITEQSAVVMIDPGHGGFDPGKNAPEGVREADINLQIALKVKDRLQEIAPNLNVVLTRDSDVVTWADNELDDLNARTQMQSSWNADFFVSIHGNSFDDASVSGYNLYIKPNDEVSSDLANSIIKRFQQANWSSNQGIITTDRSPLQVISMSKIPSTLIEVGYMTNPDDLAGMTDPKSQEKIADAIAYGIADCVEKHPVQKTDHSNTDDEKSDPANQE